MAGFHPLVITARLGSPVLGDYPIHMDAIMTEVIGGRNGLLVAGALRTDSPKIFRDVKLPLARIEKDGVKVWAASAAVIDRKLAYDYWWVRRRTSFDVEAMEKKLSIGSGPDRNMMMRRSGFTAYDARWYVIGNRQEIRRTLKMVTAIGAKRGHGLGRVLSWRVEYLPESADPLSWLVGPDGIVRRQVPLEWMERSGGSFGAVTNPYFLAAHRRRVSRVGSVGVPKEWMRNQVVNQLSSRSFLP